MEKIMRTKTINALNIQAEAIGIEPDKLIFSVEEAINKFLKLGEDDAKNLMLRLKITAPKSEPTEGEETASKSSPTLENVLEEAGLANIGIENVQKVCGDMCTAYKEAHPRCWLANKERFPEELRKVLHDDATLMTLVEDRCKAASYLAADSLKRIILLTSSEAEKYRFGGLKAMFFNNEEANALKDVANQICDYFKSFIADKLVEEKEVVAEPKTVTPKPKPEKPSNASESTPVDEHVASTDTKEVEPTPVVGNSLTAAQIISNQEVILNFISARKALIEVGIDPDKVVEKENNIRTLLIVAAAL